MLLGGGEVYNIHILCEVIISSLPDALPVTLLEPHEMVKVYSSIPGAHTYVRILSAAVTGDIICMYFV